MSSGERVLELGCGAGQKLIPIASHGHPDRGVVHVDVAEAYDAAAQVTRGTWFLSTESEGDFEAAPLEIRSIIPRELPLLLALGGLRLVERSGDWSRSPFTAESALQLCVCAVD